MLRQVSVDLLIDYQRLFTFFCFVFFSEELLNERNVQQILIPVGTTGKWQPLDVSVNKAFKVSYKHEYHQWQASNTGITKNGYQKKPGRQDFINMISRAWEKVSVESIRKSFEKAEILSKNTVNINTFGEEIISRDEENSFIEISFYNESSFIDMNSDL